MPNLRARRSPSGKAPLLYCSFGLWALGMATAAHAQSVPTAPAGELPESPSKVADEHHQQGVKALDASQPKEAFAEFAESYAITRSPRTHLMMARALVLMGDNALAHSELVTAEAEAVAARDEATAAEIRVLRDELAPKLQEKPVEDACRASRECASVGRCFTAGKACVARAQHDCKASMQCKTFDRRCTLDPAKAECSYFDPNDVEQGPPAEPEAPNSGVALLVTGGILSGLSVVNLVTSPVCKTDLIDPSIQDTCLYASLGVAGGLAFFGIPLLVGGGYQRAAYKAHRRGDSAPVVIVTPAWGGGALRVEGAF